MSTFEEKRRYPRYDTDGLGGTLVFSVQAEVSNISLSGMAVEASSPFTVGQSYSVRLGTEPNCLHLNASTRWCELAHVSPDRGGSQLTRYRAGFSFDDVLSGETARIRQFLESRIVLDVDERICGRLAPSAGHSIALESTCRFEVLKLSASGLLIETESCPAEGSLQILRLPLGEEEEQIQARVASVVQPGVQGRRLKHRLGLEFIQLSERASDSLHRFIRTELEGSGPGTVPSS